MSKVKDAWLEPPEILEDWYYDMALWYVCTEPEEEDEEDTE